MLEYISTFLPLARIFSVSGKRIISFAKQSTHELYITSEGEVYGYGNNDVGQLGIITSLTFHSSYISIPVPFLPIKIATGSDHTLMLTCEGEVYSYGKNSYGQCGKTRGEERLPSKVIAYNIKDIAATQDSSFLLEDDGRLLGAGSNYTGVLGFGTTYMISSFTTIPNLPTNIVSICAFLSTTVALTSQGEVYITGYNSDSNRFQLLPLPFPVVTVTMFYSGMMVSDKGRVVTLDKKTVLQLLHT